MKTLLHVTAARCTQIDYDPELAFVLADPGAPGIAEIWGEVLADNAATLALARSLGFEEQKTTDHVVRMVRKP